MVEMSYQNDELINFVRNCQFQVRVNNLLDNVQSLYMDVRP